MFIPHPRVKVSIVGSLRDREVACSASDRQGSNFESCVWRTVSSQSSHHPQDVLLAQFSLYVHKGGLKPDSFPPPLSSAAYHNEAWTVLFQKPLRYGFATQTDFEVTIVQIRLKFIPSHNRPDTHPFNPPYPCQIITKQLYMISGMKETSCT